MKNEYKLLLIFCCCTFFSCVTTDKYNELTQVREYLEQENENLKGLEEENRNLRAIQRKNNTDLDKAERALSELQSSFSSLDRSYQDLANRYNSLISDNRHVGDLSATEKQQLEEALAQKQIQLEQKERQLKFSEDGLSEREQKVQELTRLLGDKDAQMQGIKNRLNSALTGFAADDLSVTERDGKIYVSLSQNLLFPSGSANINTNGKQAIQRLAQILNGNPEIEINVEGHTDTDGNPISNWDLSVQRATAVVKELTNSGVVPNRIIASGRGQYKPVAPNSTNRGKAENRRTDIILSPKLEALFELMRN